MTAADASADAPGLPQSRPAGGGTSASASPGWVWGPAADLLLGCGLGYALLMPLLLGVASGFGLKAWPMAVGVALAMFVSGPHYGATLLRAYEERAERRKYALFTVWVSAGLLLLTVAALHSVWLGSLLLTLYVTWAPWHFAGQNYGLALLFLRRREITVPPATKRLLYASFVLSTVLAVLPIHSEVPRLSYALEVTGPTTTYRMQRLGIPAEVVTGGLLVAGLAYAACLAGVAASLRQRARWRDLVPAALLVATQALWFSLPGLVEGASAYEGSALTLTALWITTAHAAQYLWITAYYARRENPDARIAGYLAKATLAGAAIAFVPALVFAPSLLGTFPFEAGLGALIASVVNLHHFLLDGAIWKLRDGRVARVLLRAGAAEQGVTAPRASRSWLRPLVFALGAAGIAVTLVELRERGRFADDSIELAAAERSARRLTWMGRESHQVHMKLGRLRAEQGDAAGAETEFRRALGLLPSADAWNNIGVLRERAGSLEGALEAYEGALGVAPGDRKALWRSASVGFDLAARSLDPEEAARHRERAARRLEQLLGVAPGHDGAALRLARAYAEQGRRAEALAVLEGALSAVRPERRAALRSELERLREGAAGTAPGAGEGV
jgi:tetratricopeptide (TPR) repeat protein